MKKKIGINLVSIVLIIIGISIFQSSLTTNAPSSALQSKDLISVNPIESNIEPKVNIEKTVWDPHEEKWVEEINAQICSNVSFKLIIYNNGDYNLSQIRIIDNLPLCLEYVSGSASPIEPQVEGNNLLWKNNPVLKPGEDMSIKFDAHVIFGGKNINTAIVNATSELGLVNDSDIAIVNNTLPIMNIGKYVWTGIKWNNITTADINDTVRFKITIFNIGGINLTNIIVNGILPLGLDYTNNASPIEPKISGNNISWKYALLIPGQTIDIEFDTRTTSPGEKINNVLIATDQMPPSQDNATIFVRTLNPNLICNGILTWIDVKAGSEVTGEFTVANAGSPGSMLDWEVTEWPMWGDWTFTPKNGENLTPEAGSITVHVSVVVPDEKSQEFTGEITIVNKENTEDICTIQVSLTTLKNNLKTNSEIPQLFEKLFNYFIFLMRIINFSS